MPAFVNKSVGSFAGKSGDERTRLWPCRSKYSRNFSRISLPVMSYRYTYNGSLTCEKERMKVSLILVDGNQTTSHRRWRQSVGPGVSPGVIGKPISFRVVSQFQVLLGVNSALSAALRGIAVPKDSPTRHI